MSSIKKHPNKFRAEHLFLQKNFKIEVSKKKICQSFQNDVFYFSVFSTEMLILGVKSYFGNEGLGQDGIWFTKNERDQCQKKSQQKKAKFASDFDQVKEIDYAMEWQREKERLSEQHNIIRDNRRIVKENNTMEKLKELKMRQI